MAKIVSHPPTDKHELKLFNHLARELDDSWLLGSNIRYASKEGRGRTVDREVDIFLAHVDYGVVVIEVKGGRLERDSTNGWLHYKQETGSKEPTNAFEQIHVAKRNVISLLRAGGVPSRLITVTPYVVFTDMTRPEGELGPETRGILLFGSDLQIEKSDAPRGLFLKILKTTLGESEAKRLDLEKVQKIFFPTVKPLPYVPPKLTTDLTAIEEKMEGLARQIEELRKDSATGEIRSQIEKIFELFGKIASDAPPGTSTNNGAFDLVFRQLDAIMQRVAALTDQPPHDKDPSEEGGIAQLQSELVKVISVVTELGERLDREREDDAVQAENELASVEGSLDEVKSMLALLADQKFDASSRNRLESVLSALGIVTARVTQLSHLVDSRAFPADRFERRIDELGKSYQDVVRRLEQVMTRERPELELMKKMSHQFEQTRREFEQTTLELQEMKRQFAVGVTSNGSPVPVLRRGRRSWVLAAAVLIAVFISGIAFAARNSDTESESAPQLREGPTTTGSAPILLTVPASATTVLAPPTTPQVSTSTIQTASTIDVPPTTASTGTVAPLTPPVSVTSTNVAQGSRVTFAPVSRPTTTIAQAVVVPTSVASLSIPLLVSQIDFGEKHTCVLNPAGEVYCWGSNDAGQLGSPTFGGSFSAAPVKVELGAVKMRSLSAGKFHTCALDVTGQAFCWGLNASGQLGIDSTDRVESVARPVVGGLTFTSLSSGALSTCGLTTDARVFCWGGNGNNELASDNGYSTLKPVEASGGWRFTRLEVGQGSLGCGVETTGLLLCWGYSDDEYGAIEQYLYDMRFNAAVMGVGADHVCLIIDGVDLRCISWYTNSVGGVGDNRESMGRSKGRLPEPFVSVVGGYQETCGLTADGRVYCWGDRPTLVESDKRFVSLVVRSDRKCGVTASNELYCWGRDADGRSSSGLTTGKPSPVALFVNKS